MRRIKAFTLIELLVVVAIIAVLIAILLPSLGKAREKARQVACSANLHGFGIAIQTYMTEYNKALTTLRSPGGFTPDAFWVYNTHGDQISIEAMLPYMHGVNGVDQAAHPEGSLQQSDIQITKAWVCPSQPFFATNSDVPVYKWFTLNYSYFAGFDIDPTRSSATTPDDLFGHTSQPNKILMEDSFYRQQGGGGRWDINHGVGGGTAHHNSGPFIFGPPKFTGNNVLTSDYAVRFKQAGEYVTPTQLDTAPSAGPHVNGGGGDQMFY